MFKLKCVEPFSQSAHILLYQYHYLHFLPIQQKVNNIIMDNAIPAQIYDVVADHIAKPDVTPIILFCCSQDVFPLISYLSATSFVSFVIVIPVTFIIINLLSVYAKTILFLLLLTTGLISPSSAPGLYWYKSTLSARWHGQPDLRLPQSYIPSPGHESRSNAGACAA